MIAAISSSIIWAVFSEYSLPPRSTMAVLPGSGP